MHQLKIFSSNLNTYAVQETSHFHEFSFTEETIFFSRQITMRNPGIKYFYDFYVFLFFTEATDSFAGTIESHIT